MASTAAKRFSHRALLKPVSVSQHSSAKHRLFTTSMTAREAKAILATNDEIRARHLNSSLQPLLNTEGGKWTVKSDRKGISREIRFKTFRQASNFMIAMIPKIAEVRHHPTWTNTYNSVDVTWSTHVDKETKMAGISELDVQMANTTDEVAAEFGEQSST